MIAYARHEKIRQAEVLEIPELGVTISRYRCRRLDNNLGQTSYPKARELWNAADTT